MRRNGMKSFYMILAALPLLAAPAGVTQWSSSQLKGLPARLADKMTPQKLALEQLGQFGNHSLMAVHREADGESEVHVTQVDIFIVQDGHGTLETGGEVVGGRSTGPGEIRGTSIKGGHKMSIATGDIVHIPPSYRTRCWWRQAARSCIVKVNTP
jgi:hypothetical protein